MAGLLSIMMMACTPAQVSPSVTAILPAATDEPSETPVTQPETSEPATLAPTPTQSVPTQTPQPETATAEAASRACALLSRDEVEAAIGALKFDPQPTNSVGGTGTFWNCRYDGASAYLFVSFGPEGGISASQYFDRFLAGAKDVEKIADLGEQAFWNPRNKAPGELYDGILLVLHEDVVYLFYLGAENARDTAIGLARLVVTRVP
jgi:hypothetical protein